MQWCELLEELEAMIQKGIEAGARLVAGGLGRPEGHEHPIQDFDYKTPEAPVSEGRASAVIQYSERLHAGATG